MQLVSLAGAFLILIAYAAIQRAWLKPASKLYALLNLVGSLLLLWVAINDRRLGFILLEALWALVSIPPLLRTTTDTANA